jgi:hypothetical protein
MWRAQGLRVRVDVLAKLVQAAAHHHARLTEPAPDRWQPQTRAVLCWRTGSFVERNQRALQAPVARIELQRPLETSQARSARGCQRGEYDPG